MIAFLISLFVVDRRQRQWRVQQHPSGHEPTSSRWAHWPWLHPEPYQDTNTGYWQQSATTAAEVSPDGAYGGWFAHWKHRAIAKLEIGDALALRGRVIVAMLIWLLMASLLATYSFKRTYEWLFST